MTAPKSFKRFSAGWFDLFNAFKDEPHVIREIECQSHTRAMALRLEFYKARKAFLDDPELGAEYEAALNSREVTVEGNKAIFGLKDNWINDVIHSSLHTN